jgi:hypothetical protein
MNPYSKEILNGVPNLLVLKNQDGLTFRDFRQQLKPNYGVVVANIIFSWSMIALAVLGFAALNSLRVSWLPYASSLLVTFSRVSSS